MGEDYDCDGFPVYLEPHPRIDSNAEIGSAGFTTTATCEDYDMRNGFDSNEFYPVRSVVLDSGGRYRSEFCGVRRECDDRDVHNEDLERMKRAEQITDAVYLGCRDSGGHSAWIIGDGAAYVAGLYGCETRLPWIGFSYREAYADIVDKLEFIELFGSLDIPTCVGGWVHDGELFLDVSVGFTDRDKAIDFARRNDQIAVYDAANDTNIPV